MTFFRAHGLGNDYLVSETVRPISPSLARTICDRHTGLGSDGILAPFETTHADYGVTIWNPDGSVAEKSGNGLRIFAWWLAQRGAVSPFTIWTGHDRVTCWVSGTQVRVEMGTPSFAPAALPVLSDAPIVDAPWVVAGEAVQVTCVSMGNPHCVCFVTQSLETVPWRAIGEHLTDDPRFPNRTNVQIATVRDGSLEIRIWERGAGETQASGSSACAAAVAAVRTGRLPSGRIAVTMPGGNLFVTTNENVILEGPVTPLAQIHPDVSWVASWPSDATS